MSRRRSRARGCLALGGLTLVVSVALSGCGQEVDQAVIPTPGASLAAESMQVPRGGKPAHAADKSEATSAPTAGVQRAVPPPVDSDLSDRVPVERQVVLEGVDVTEPVVVEEVKISVRSVERRRTEAEGPGEIGGPSVAISVSLVNGTSAPLDLSSVTVTATDTEGAPLIPLSGGPARPFDGVAPSKGQVQGIYVFSLARVAVPLTITVNLAADAPVAVFTAALSE